MVYKIPPLKKKKGRTYIEAVVNLDHGFGPFIGLRKFVSEAGSYGKRVYLKSPEDDSITDLYSILNAMRVSTPRGKKLEVIVEGTDKAAERMALRIYSGLTSKDSNNPDFDRFEEEN